MKKNILEKIIVVTLSMLFLAGVCLLEGMSVSELVDNLTFLFLAIWTYILLDDFIAKVIWYRFAITKRYLVYEGCYLGALVMLTGAFLTHSFGWAVGDLVAFVVFFIAALVLHWKAYVDPAYTSFEIERAKWRVISAKLKDMSGEDVRQKAYEFLRYYPKRGRLEANLSLRCPVDPTGANRTLQEMMEGETDIDILAEAQAGIDKLVDDYLFIRDGEKEEKEK